MSLYFYKSTLKRMTTSLVSQIDTFRAFAEVPQFPEGLSERAEFCLRRVAAMENAASIISASRNEILTVLEAVHKEYAEVKKSERKEFLEEFQQIENEVLYEKAISESDALLTEIKTRLGEVKYEHNAIAKKADLHAPTVKSEDGALPQNVFDNALDLAMQTCEKINEIALKGSEDLNAREIERNSTSQKETLQSSSENSSRQKNTVASENAQIATSDNEHPMMSQTCATIKPPRATIPHFSGNIEDFQEYWAVFKAMVHDNPSLNETEKMILFKDSLTGKAATTIKGIKMIPQNYLWMVETIRKKYDNLTNARANVIRRLVSLTPAKDNSKSCEAIFDSIRSLVNEMTSSGYRVSEVQDPMWIETILKKFPRHIVEDYLKENKNGESFTVGETRDRLETVIIRDAYIAERLGQQNATFYATNVRANDSQKGYVCRFCGKTNHKSYQCRTVKDPTERRKVVMDKTHCWKCFAPDHKSSDCKRPNCRRCDKLHDESLCLQKTSGTTSGKTAESKKSIAQSYLEVQSTAASTQAIPLERTQMDNCFNMSSSIVQQHHTQTNESDSSDQDAGQQIVLMTAEGMVWDNNSKSYQRALFFFDAGAQVSLILEKSAEHLALPVFKTEQCSLSGIGAISETFLSYHVVLRIQTAQGRELEFPMKTKPTLTTGFPSVYLTERDTKFMEENNIFLTNTRMRGEYQIPHILIGLDLYISFVHEAIAPIQLPTGLRVARTVFGFAAYGRGKVEANINCAHLSCNALVSESDILKNMFELEGLGISSKEGAEDVDAYAYLFRYAKLIRYEDQSVSAPFPLKANVMDLSDNYCLALRRLIALLRHLDKSPKQKEWYTKIISQYLEQDIIEEVIAPVPGSVGTYYMPQSGVWKESKPTPLRIVFDASSRQKGRLSLNDVIHTGASFVNKIHDILVSSREKPIILIADIQAAFTQIRIHESHRDLCRFIWVRDPDKPTVQDNLVEYRWKRVPFGITSSPSMLNMVLSAHLQNLDTPLANEILTKLYVDNVLMGACSIEEAIEKYRQSKAIFAAIGMNLRAFVSNCEEVNAQIEEQDRAPYEPMKLLGVDYNPISDTYSLNTEFPSKPKLKREFLRQHHSVYDPIGLGAPLMIAQKQLLRKIFEEKIDWNEAIDTHIAEEWNKVTASIDKFHVQNPRQLFCSQRGSSNPNLWVFADASSQAMAVCAYMESSDSKEVSHLISGKTKLAPKKRALTTPKLELLAILLALRLAESVVSAVSEKVSQINIVSDSLIALSWIRSPRKLPLFVANQRNRIKTLINKLMTLGCICHLYHIAGDKNPADVGTCGISSKQLAELEWVKGPQ